MLSLQQRVELLETDLGATPPAFIMSRELPFALFRYEPAGEGGESEWVMRNEVQKLVTRLRHDAGRNVAVVSLAELYWRSIRESEGVETVIALEQSHGFAAAERQVTQYLSDEDFCPLQRLILEASERLADPQAIMFLIHATVFAPATYRVSSLLEQLGGKLRRSAVLFYPGSWDRTLNYMGAKSPDQALGSYRVKIYGRES